ncbi:MAG: hypothetical protein QXL34_06600 [Thermosphaera sp.]
MLDAKTMNLSGRMFVTTNSDYISDILSSLEKTKKANNFVNAIAINVNDFENLECSERINNLTVFRFKFIPPKHFILFTVSENVCNN